MAGSSCRAWASRYRYTTAGLSKEQSKQKRGGYAAQLGRQLSATPIYLMLRSQQTRLQFNCALPQVLFEPGPLVSGRPSR
eukprot:4538141-Pleurochrysis_carterae.AAC.1